MAGYYRGWNDSDMESRYSLATQETHDRIHCGMSCATCSHLVYPEHTSRDLDLEPGYCTLAKKKV